MQGKIIYLPICCWEAGGVDNTDPLTSRRREDGKSGQNDNRQTISSTYLPGGNEELPPLLQGG